MSKLNSKQIALAKELMKKHGKEIMYVIAETGQMYFSKNNAELTAKGKELVEVKRAEEEVKKPDDEAAVKAAEEAAAKAEADKLAEEAAAKANEEKKEAKASKSATKK